MLKKRSVFNRILIPLIVVQIFQISLFGMLVFSGGVITKLDRNAEEILNERVKMCIRDRSGNLQRNLAQSDARSVRTDSGTGFKERRGHRQLADG